MKKLLATLLLSCSLTGCGLKADPVDDVLALRQNLLNATSCSFTTEIHADYGEELYTFSLACNVVQQGELSFSVLKPESICGITGLIDSDGGKLTFDDNVLTFPTLVEGMITPVSAPWVMVNTLRSGYISAAGVDDGLIHAIIYDSYEEQALRLDFWLDAQCSPVRCEILWDGKRILSADVVNFEIV